MPTQKSFSPADPAIVPVEGPALNEKAVASGAQRKTASLAATQANPYGQNNEQLPERLQEALRRLVHQFSFESEVNAPPGSSPDQAGASILARAAIFVVERARPELASAVRAEADGQFVAGRFAAV